MMKHLQEMPRHKKNVTSRLVCVHIMLNNSYITTKYGNQTQTIKSFSFKSSISKHIDVWIHGHTHVSQELFVILAVIQAVECRKMSCLIAPKSLKFKITF